MLAIDTNVVVRFLTRDDPVQSPRAFDLINRNDVLVPVTVVLETEWVLRSVYRYAPAEFSGALRALAGLPRLELQRGAEVDRALTLHEAGMDFGDALHLLLADGCAEFLTFDRPYGDVARRLGLSVREA